MKNTTTCGALNRQNPTIEKHQSKMTSSLRRQTAAPGGGLSTLLMKHYKVQRKNPNKQTASYLHHQRQENLEEEKTQKQSDTTQVLDPLKKSTRVTLIHTPSSSTYPKKTLFLFPTKNREDP
jgi:hypothetical protein